MDTRIRLILILDAFDQRFTFFLVLRSRLCCPSHVENPSLTNKRDLFCLFELINLIKLSIRAMPMFFTSQKKFNTEVSKRAAELCDQIMIETGAELHDDLIQKLSVFRLYIDRLEKSAHDRSEVESVLIKMRADFETVIDSVRRISNSFLPEQINDYSFNTVIKTLCKSLEKPGLGTIYLTIDGKERAISEISKRYLYRVVQELIHNAFKHSSAWHVHVRLNWTHHRLFISVEDDGSGFNKLSQFIETLKKKNNTLRLRTQAIGASITYHHGSKGLLASVEYHL